MKENDGSMPWCRTWDYCDYCPDRENPERINQGKIRCEKCESILNLITDKFCSKDKK